jgi:hypothetical protein
MKPFATKRTKPKAPVCGARFGSDPGAHDEHRLLASRLASGRAFAGLAADDHHLVAASFGARSTLGDATAYAATAARRLTNPAAARSPSTSATARRPSTSATARRPSNTTATPTTARRPAATRAAASRSASRDDVVQALVNVHCACEAVLRENAGEGEGTGDVVRQKVEDG